MKIPCSNCNQRLEIPEELAGQTIQCPACNASLAVPALTATPSATPQVQITPQQEKSPKRSVSKRKSLVKPKTTSKKKSKPQIPKWAVAAVAVAVVGLMIFLFSGSKHPPNAIHGAVNTGNIKLVKQLLDDGVDVNQKFVFADGPPGNTPLHLTSHSKQIAELLIKRGANVNAKDSTGKTPLHDVAYDGSLSVLKLLIENGADVNAQDNKGRTPKDSAFIGIQSDKDFGISGKIKEREEIIRHLSKHGG
jgi:hypothetical protein